MDVTFFLNPSVEVKETASRNSTGESANKNCGSGALAKIATCADSNSTGERSVKQNFHFKLAELDQSNVARNECGGGNGEHCVHDNALLLGTISEGTIERGPVHPEEDCTNHSDKLALVVTFTTSGIISERLSLVEEQRCGDTEIGAKSVHIHGATAINSSEEGNANGFIKAEEKDLKSGQNE